LSEYIEKEAARPDEFCVGVSCQECPFLKDPLYGGCRVDDFIMELPPADVVPWSFLERYADWFCALVQYPEFIREAKRFYLDSISAMEGGGVDG
jgi:hypothetical protein